MTAHEPSRVDRVVGAVLGGAIGDALGAPVEFVRSVAAIRRKYPPAGITGFVHWDERPGVDRYGGYTDDTQMSEVVLRSLLDSIEAEDDLDAAMRHLADGFVEWSRNPQGGHHAPGNACLAGCSRLAAGVPWNEAGGEDAGGCGSVMRVHPFGLLFADDPERAEAWAVAHSRLTHRAPIAFAACAAMTAGVAALVRGETAEKALAELTKAARRHDAGTADMIERALDEAAKGIGPEVTLDRLQGWAAHEAIAAAVYVFARHTDDPRSALLEGANTPGDSDSISSMAGVFSGARSGVDSLPGDWVHDVERSADLRALAGRAAGVQAG